MTQEDYYKLVVQMGSIRKAAEALGIPSSTFRRRMGRERNGGVQDGRPLGVKLRNISHEGRIDVGIENGTAIVFSDAHFYPGVKTTSYRALVAMIKQLEPAIVVCNGDAFDGSELSRFASIGWETKPSVKDELDAVAVALGDIESAAGSAKLIWPMGNHDMRYETKIANALPQLRGVQGVHLKDFFPNWSPCWTLWVNGDTCITHFYQTGMHAIWNNLLKGQCNYISSHRHTPEVRAYTRADGTTIFGVDTGTLADALGAHNLDYQQGRHGNHRSAFAVLTWRDGELLMPELCQKWDEDHVQFRGHILHADTLKIA